MFWKYKNGYFVCYSYHSPVLKDNILKFLADRKLYCESSVYKQSVLHLFYNFMHYPINIFSVFTL